MNAFNAVAIEVARGDALSWAVENVERGHYLHSAPDQRSRPMAYRVSLGGEPVGCLFFGRPEATRCYVGGLTYGSLGDVVRGRAVYDRWEVLNLSRVWFCPAVQPGGRWHSPECLPGFLDRKGTFRSTLVSDVIRIALVRVGFDYLASEPPVYTDQPYQIRAVLSYCDTRKHRGVIYRAAGFELARVNKAGIETWWTRAVAPLSADQDARVHELAASNPRCRRLRERSRTLFPTHGGD